MQIKTFPHEFLARWDRDGRLQGYHVVPVEILCDDAGVPLKNDDQSNKMESFGVATTLDRAGLDLSDLLGEGLQTVLVANDRLRAALNQRTAELGDATRALDAAAAAQAEAEAQATAAAEQIQHLNTQLAEAQAVIAELQAQLAATARSMETP